MSATAEPWRIELLGGLKVSRGNTQITHFETRKVDALLALLALRPERAQTREMLADQLWPDEDIEATRNRFRHALSSLRHALEGSDEGNVLRIDRVEVGLVPGSSVIDAQEYKVALKSSLRAETETERITYLRSAVSLYQGELMPGYYEDMIVSAREQYAEEYRVAALELARLLAHGGDNSDAIEFARTAVKADPFQEEAQRFLLRLYVDAGRTPDAIRQYRELERLLWEEIGTAPAAETRALLNSVRVDTAPAADAAGDNLRAALLSFDLVSEAEGGAVPLDSPYYILRQADAQFESALRRKDSIVLIKGARQTGKTSLLARGLHWARDESKAVANSDLQDLTAEQLGSPDAFCFALAEGMAEQLDLEIDLDSLWSAPRSWNVKFERFLRKAVLGQLDCPLIWGLDEVDRLFGQKYGSELFGMFRSWHNQRALNPGGPWGGLTLAIAYATEAHLFITDLNQSPFNVGTRLALGDFTRGEVEEMNRRYHSPLRSGDEIERYYALLGGNPYLVRRGLNALVTDGLSLAEFESQAIREGGIFGDPLARMLASLRRDPDLLQAMRGILNGETPTVDQYFRLHSAGLIAGDSPTECRPRCRLYAVYLERQLR